jgi:hypothetical protein
MTDLFSRRVAGCSASTVMAAQLVGDGNLAADNPDALLHH